MRFAGEGQVSGRDEAVDKEPGRSRWKMRLVGEVISGRSSFGVAVEFRLPFGQGLMESDSAWT